MTDVTNMMQHEDHVYTSACESDFVDGSFAMHLQRKDSMRKPEFRRAITKPTMYPSGHTTKHTKHARLSTNKDVYARSSKPPKPVQIKVTSSEEHTSISDNLEADSQSQKNMGSTKIPSHASTSATKGNTRKSHERLSQRNKKHSENSDSGIGLQRAIFADSPFDDSIFTQENDDILKILEQLQHIIRVYQMKLTQKDEMLEMHALKIVALENRLRSMEQENDHLKNLIQNAEAKMPVSLEDWKLVQEQAEMVIDVNEALTEQLNHLQNKIRETQVHHKKQEIVIRQSLDACNDEKSIISQELQQLQKRFEFLRDEYNVFRLQENDKMSREEHSLSVQECTRLLGILKEKYEQGIHYANTRLKAVLTQKKNLIAQTTQLKSAYQELSAENKVLVTSYRKGLTKLHHLSKSYTKKKMDCLQLKMKLKLVQNQVNEMVIRENILEQNERLTSDRAQNMKMLSYEQKLQQLQRLLAKRHVKLRKLNKLPGHK